MEVKKKYLRMFLLLIFIVVLFALVWLLSKTGVGLIRNLPLTGGNVPTASAIPSTTAP